MILRGGSKLLGVFTTKKAPGGQQGGKRKKKTILQRTSSTRKGGVEGWEKKGDKTNVGVPLQRGHHSIPILFRRKRKKKKRWAKGSAVCAKLLEVGGNW